MPKTWRTDTFMSGSPAGSFGVVMAAVINPPWSRTRPDRKVHWAAVECVSRT